MSEVAPAPGARRERALRVRPLLVGALSALMAATLLARELAPADPRREAEAELELHARSCGEEALLRLRGRDLAGAHAAGEEALRAWARLGGVSGRTGGGTLRRELCGELGTLCDELLAEDEPARDACAVLIEACLDLVPPRDVPRLRARAARCRADDQALQRYAEAAAIVEARDVNRYPRALGLLLTTPPGGRLELEAAAWRGWLGAELLTREADRLWRAGQTVPALERLREACQEEGLGSEAFRSLEQRYKRWSAVLFRCRRAGELAEADPEQARDLYEQILELEPDPAHPLHQEAFQALVRLAQRDR